MDYIPTIGLEIHAELKTSSKMFCPCKNDPDEDRPNRNVCPICLGHPGTLPVLNHEAIRHVLRIGVAVGGQLADFTEWDRKNYFYPDIPKGYQISQYKYPLVSGGELAGIELERIHLEEDTAQSTHDTHENSLVNFNRSGVPLMELVTKPVVHSASEAVAFAKELQLLLRYLDAGNANLEKGEMRVEANISVATADETAKKKFGTKTEVKNLNSFRSVGRAIEYEIERQIAVLQSLGKVVQETRGWDDDRSETYSQRSKESSHDYRYFPEPDIPKLKISEMLEFAIEHIKKEIPELPWQIRDKYLNRYNMTPKETAVFVDSPVLTKYFESVITGFASDAKKIKLATNYLLSDYLGLLKKDDIGLESGLSRLSPAHFSELIEMIAANHVSSRAAKDLLPVLMKESKISPKELAERSGLVQKSDAESISPAIDKVLIDNAKAVQEYKAGKLASLQYLIGQAMRSTKGAANPEVIKKILLEKLSS